jgi:predicted Zn-dependent protease
MIPANRAKQALARVLSASRKIGKAQGEVIAIGSLRASLGGNTRFGASEVSQAALVERIELTVTIGLGRRRASASTNQLDAGAIDDAVDRAARLARLSPESAEAMPPLGPQRYSASGAAAGAVDAATSTAGASVRAGAAKLAIDRARAAGLAIAGYYEHEHRSTSLASSAGLWAHHESTRARFSCSARTPDGSGAGWAGGASHKIADLAAERYVTTAIAKAQAAAKPRRLEPGKYTVILEPAAAAALTRFVPGSLDARGADEGRNYFSKAGGKTKLGERLFPDTITIHSDPADFAADGEPFDEEGVPQRAVRWIDRGVLTQLPYDRYWAQKQGKPATGNPNGLSLDGGNASRDELIKGVSRGLLITRFFYLGLVDPQSLLVTGLTRDGVFLIERGAIAGPVNNFRFNHSAAELLQRCDGLGAAEVVYLDGGSRMRAPLLRSHEFNLTSVSEAI